MKPNLPYWLFVGGIGALSLADAGKKLFPATLGHAFAFNWGCAIISAILFSVGLFLSLYGLFSQPDNRRRFVLPCICNLSPPVVLMCMYFFMYVVSADIYNFGEHPPDFLPSLIKGTQVAATEAKRFESAEVAYKIYDVELTYRRDAGDFVVFVPTQKDIALRREQKKTEAENQQVLATLKGAFDQWPYLFAFYMGAFFLTFSIGPLWMAFRTIRTKD